MQEYKSYKVWDAGTRWFHWINVLCIIGLIAIGILFLNDDALELTKPSKILLKTVHVWVGYVFAINLAWRLIWGFIGGPYARWCAVLPCGRGFIASSRAYVADFMRGRTRPYVGHNPLGRLAVAVMLVLLLVQAVTGLVLAGTDIFYPPLGGWIANWIAAPGVDPNTLLPYAKEMYDPTAYEAMRNFRGPFIETHETVFFLLVFMILLHIAAVIVTEVKEGGTLISAMFTGRKIIQGKPAERGRAEGWSSKD